MQIKSIEDVLELNPTLNPDKNEVTEKKDYYISYNPCTFDEGKAETALVHDSNYYILYGDFRPHYKELTTIEECKDFFKSHVKHNPHLVGYTSDTCE